jgi:hypothetical protein
MKQNWRGRRNKWISSWFQTFMKECVSVFQKMRRLQVPFFPKSLHPEVPGGCKSDDCGWWREEMTKLSVEALLVQRCSHELSREACYPRRSKKIEQMGHSKDVETHRGLKELTAGYVTIPRERCFSISFKLARYLREIFVCK